MDLFLPRVCASCGAGLVARETEISPIDAVLCSPCRRALPLLEPGGCLLCQLPTSDFTVSPHAEVDTRLADTRTDKHCPRCRAEASPLSACVATVAFSGSAENWVYDFKYPRNGIAGLAPGPESVVVALARQAARTAMHGSALPLPDGVFPIPLHPRRLRERGFNPAATLAKAIAREVGAPLSTHILSRNRDNPTQTHLGRRQRQANVRGAFSCQSAAPKTVWLVDDVVTTRSTLEEAARCLRRAGARHVVGVCAARTLQTL
jgi:ComF family protein